MKAAPMGLTGNREWGRGLVIIFAWMFPCFLLKPQKQLYLVKSIPHMGSDHVPPLMTP